MTLDRQNETTRIELQIWVAIIIRLKESEQLAFPKREATS
jgi:hypothetical protein